MKCLSSTPGTRHYSSEKGFTLLEVMIVMALIGVASLVMSQLFINQAKQQRSSVIKGNVEQLRSAIQNVAKDPDALHFSAQHQLSGNLINPQLNACVKHTGMNDTNRDCDEAWAPLPQVRLFTRDGREINGFYNLDGVRCDTATAATQQCPISVTAKLRPICPQNPALTVAQKCSRAQKIQIAWKIEQQVQVPGFPQFRGAEADVTNSTSAMYAVPVSTQNIEATQNLQVNCPTVILTSAMLKQNGGLYDNKYAPLVGTTFSQSVSQVDTYGQQVCGIEIGALDAELLKREVCRLWITQAWNGMIDPNNDTQKTVPSCDLQVIKRFRLLGAPNHTTDDCKGKPGFDAFVMPDGTFRPSQITLPGGIVQHLDGTPFAQSEVAKLQNDYGLSPSSDGTIFCRFNSGSCPSPLSWHQGWSTTTSSEAEIKTRYRTWGLTSGCGYSWSGNGCSSPDACPGTTARDGSKCVVNGHAWSDNSALEAQTCWNRQRGTAGGVCGTQACNCDQPVTSGTDTNWRVDVAATRTQIGCK